MVLNSELRTPNSRLRLGLNIDHVATLRNARGGFHPDPVRAAQEAIAAGADGITAHLREDRRHIRDEDIARLMAEVDAPLNLEMAATEEMLAIALKTKPHAVCLVPEKRMELTTEGGLDVAGNLLTLKPYIQKLSNAGIRVSLFIDPDPRQLEAAVAAGAPVVELHTGSYCHNISSPVCGGGGNPSQLAGRISGEGIAGGAMPSPCPLPHTGEGFPELNRLVEAASLTAKLGLECHAGHGLNFENVGAVAAIPQMRELNIGHFLIGEAVFIGLGATVREIRARMDAAKR